MPHADAVSENQTLRSKNCFFILTFGTHPRGRI